ncbi:serine/threonine protein kinase [Roseiconus nitratireducens]|uniref:Serine/threonine protein kinase n=1 Tax=Roseiconus nitratireducens TaxID=2605748 RepID=A0A5M6DD18_9BACT|nr:serine/threonine-protein kinase [Roseiconus nitratireducens]KAA5545424.1 serine/threonine protein kinase [Roseiconus nitratireducens]
MTERTIFLQALELSSADARGEYLTQACGNDDALRQAVDQLLDAHELPDNLLDRPVAVSASDQAGRTSEVNSVAIGTLGQPVGITESVGTEVGRYKLREQIGEGGFGLVFVAEQQYPVRRHVALKIIKPGMDSREVIGRFEAERQAVAVMNHPNIASVLDAGTTKSGRPYFVMELVRGVPITEFCQRRQLSLRARLELFTDVCHAVQHAHQKGVIHRDLKPSNILVTLHDVIPVVKVIDFGVAKAIGHRLTDRTVYTQFAAMIGTPLYMSPEQAEMSGLDVDTRSDIYGLGVLLYELLTGGTPFERERFNTASIDEVRRIIREEDPPKPSTRLTTLGASPSTHSDKRQCVPAELSFAVRGDLDWIVMKALEKDRSRRYESASAMAEDVKRFLSEQPIEARPPSRLYQLQKFAQRNKAAIVTASLLVAAMFLGTAISLWQAAVAVTERNEKDQALQKAVRLQREADQARLQIEQFAKRMKEANILVTSGRAHADAERWGAAYADFTAATRRQPNYYNAWSERASLQVRLGLWKLAADDYAQAIELGVPTDNPANWGIPQLFLFNGDLESFRAYCRDLINQSEQRSEGVSIAVIRSCVMSSERRFDVQTFATRMEEMIADFDRFPDARRHRFDRHDRHDDREDREKDASKPPSEEHLTAAKETPKKDRDLDRDRSAEPDQTASQPGQNDADSADAVSQKDDPDQPDESAKPPWYCVFYPRGAALYVAGLAHLRADHFKLAVKRLNESLDEVEWHGRSIAYPALAMAYHRAGETEKSRQALASAKAALDQWADEIYSSPVGRMPVMWIDWLEAQLLYREASILMTGFVPADDVRLRRVRQRAVSLLGERDFSSDEI